MKIHESPQLFPGCFILGPIPTPIPTPEPASHLARSGISRLGGRSTWVESDPCCYAAPKWWSWQVLTGKTWETYWKLGKYGNMRLWTYIPLLMLYWAYQYGGEHQKRPSSVKVVLPCWVNVIFMGHLYHGKLQLKFTGENFNRASFSHCCWSSFNHDSP